MASDGRDHWLVPSSFSSGVIRIPPRLASTLQEFTATGAEWPDAPPLALHIRIRDQNVSVRDLAAYLAFADRIYGRLKAGSLIRYRRRRDGHMTISEFQCGSLDIVIRDTLDTLSSPTALVLTGLALKYLPDLIKAPAAAFRDYQEGRLTAAKRKRLLARARADDRLASLDARDLSQLISVLAKIYEAEHARLAAPQNFAVQSVQDVSLEGRRRHPD